jgi:hypothetical protein
MRYTRIHEDFGHYGVGCTTSSLYFSPTIAVYDRFGIFIRNLYPAGYYPSIKNFSAYYEYHYRWDTCPFWRTEI